MAKTITENNEKTFEKQAFQLFMILSKLVVSDRPVDMSELESEAATAINSMLGTYDDELDAFEIKDFKLVKAYLDKIPWHKLPINKVPDKVYHPIVTIKKDETEVTLGYSNAQNTLTFSKNGGAIKYFKFKNKIEQEQLQLFVPILKKLLK
jgi:hypothetical protein